MLFIKFTEPELEKVISIIQIITFMLLTIVNMISIYMTHLYNLPAIIKEKDDKKLKMKENESNDINDKS
jgi:hypothetical protein